MSGVLFGVDPDTVAVTTDDWYTPTWVFAAAGITFDVDVAAPVNPAHRTCPARRYLTPADDGLTTPWNGTVWCNPPYSQATPWVDRWANHPDGLILLPAIPEVHWLGTVMSRCDAFTLLAINFGRPDGKTTRLRWPVILAARGALTESVPRIANSDRYAAGAYLIGAG